jgi:hypothetical protein
MKCLFSFCVFITFYDSLQKKYNISQRELRWFLIIMRTLFAMEPLSSKKRHKMIAPDEIMQQERPSLYAMILTVRASWDNKRRPVYPDIRKKNDWTLLEEAINFVFVEQRCTKRKKTSIKLTCRKGNSKRCMPVCDGGW